MLCFIHSDHGEICTNRCQSWSDCSTRKRPSYMKVPFLVEAVDRLVSEIQPQNVDGLFLITYKPYCITPQAFVNGAADESTFDDTSNMRLS